MPEASLVSKNVASWYVQTYMCRKLADFKLAATEGIHHGSRAFIAKGTGTHLRGLTTSHETTVVVTFDS